MTCTITIPTWILIIFACGFVLPMLLFCGYLAWLLWWPGEVDVREVTKPVDPSYGDSIKDSAS